MLSREDVLTAYRLILKRDPESEAAIVAHQAEPSLEELGRRLLGTEEFRKISASGLMRPSAPKWVCAEIRHGLKLWIDLSDQAVSAGCLQDDWEPAETDFILSILEPGDGFVDVGANIGWFSVLAAHAVGAEGRVYAFEPRADRFERLVQSIADNGFAERCQAESFALGAAESEARLAWVPSERNPGHSFLLRGEAPEGAAELGSVPVRPLDSFDIRRRIRLMKIDVEGGELQVLEGARALIARDQPVLLLEIFPFWLDAVGRATPRALIAELNRAGYRVFRLGGVGLGRELRAGDDGSEAGGPEYFNVAALSDRDCRLLLSRRLDHRVTDLERRLTAEADGRAEAESAARLAETRAAAVAARLSEAEAQAEDARARAEAAEARAARAEAEAAKARAAETKAADAGAEAASVAARAMAAARAGKARADAAAAAASAAVQAAQARAAADSAAAAQAAEAARQTARLLEEELALTRARLSMIEASSVWQATYPLRRAGFRVPAWLRRTLRRAARLTWWGVTGQLPARLRGYRTAGSPPSLAGAGAARELPAPPGEAGAEVRPEDQPSRDEAPPLSPAGPAAPRSLLPPAGGPRAFIIDSRWPREDQDSGSIDAIEQVRALIETGYQVVFSCDTEYDAINPYRMKIEAEGVVCIGSDRCASIDSFFESDGHGLDLCVLSRVYCGGRFLEAARRHAPQAQIVFNTVDLHYTREEREARHTGDLTMLRNADATRERELYLVRQADATIVVSRTERAILEAAVPGARVFEMPLSRPVRPFASLPGFAERSGVGFVGGFAHTPNVDAVRYLLQDIWPLVLRRLPGARLSIAGVGLPIDVLAGAPPGVEYAGHVPDLDSWMDRLRVTVAPLRYGAGAKGKVASSLAAGVPCVGTRIAAEGMRLTDGEHIAVADEPDDFAARICALHEDAAAWERLSSGGHAQARREFSLEAGRRRLAEMLAALGLPHRAPAAGEDEPATASRRIASWTT